MWLHPYAYILLICVCVCVHVCVYRPGPVQMCKSCGSGRKNWERTVTLPKLLKTSGPNKRVEVNAHTHTQTHTVAHNPLPLILIFLLWPTAVADIQARCQHTRTDTQTSNHASMSNHAALYTNMPIPIQTYISYSAQSQAQTEIQYSSRWGKYSEQWQSERMRAEETDMGSE